MWEPSGKRVLLLAERNPLLQDVQLGRDLLTLVDAGYQVVIICQQGLEQRWHVDYRGIQIYSYPTLSTSKERVSGALKNGYQVLATLLLSGIVLVREGFDHICRYDSSGCLSPVETIYQWLGKKTSAPLLLPIPSCHGNGQVNRSSSRLLQA